MKTLVTLIFSVLAMGSCTSQTEQKISQTDSKNTVEPKIETRVNVEYDDDGNIIRYDSIYSYYYSSIDKDAINESQMDSIFNNFSQYFDSNNNIDGFIFEEFFKQNNYLDDAFFSEDFFLGSIEDNRVVAKQDEQT